jgi:hypothetical protein
MSVPQVKDYTLVERLGSGSYATVYKGFKKVCRLKYMSLARSVAYCKVYISYVKCGSRFCRRVALKMGAGRLITACQTTLSYNPGTCLGVALSCDKIPSLGLSGYQFVDQ